MQVSDQIIQVLDYIGKKLGLTIDGLLKMFCLMCRHYVISILIGRLQRLLFGLLLELRVLFCL